MTRRLPAAIVVVIAAVATVAHGQPAAPAAPAGVDSAAGVGADGASAAADPASAAFRAAAARRAGGDLAGAADGFAAVADRHPGSPWADDARMEAALALEQLGRYGEARTHLERLLADFPGSRLVRRARARLDQIVTATGAGGEWATVAAEHDAILRTAAAAEDPTPALEQLETLVRRHPGYPRGHDARMFLGDGWLRQGAWQRALAWYRAAESAAATPATRFQASRAVAGALLVHGELDDAERVIAALRAQPGADRRALDEAEAALVEARTRQRGSRLAALALVFLVALGVVVIRRDAGSWAAVLRAIARPPVEVLYFVPVAALLVLGSRTGNRIVAAAVLWIAGAGLGLAWLSGVSLDQARRRGPLGAGRVIAHVVVAAVAVAAVAYLAVMRDRLLDMLVETWRHGHDGG